MVVGGGGWWLVVVVVVVVVVMVVVVVVVVVVAADIANAIKAAKEKWGSLDIMVNNAGVCVRARAQ